MQWIDASIILLYMAAVLGIGFYFSRGENTSEEYLLGGRRMPYLAIGISCMMSLLSSVSIVVVPGEIFKNGIALFALGSLLGPLLSIAFFFLFTRFYFKIGSFTPYEYLELRYNRAVSSIIAGSSLYLRTLYLGTVLFTTSKIFEGAYGWESWFTIVLVGVVGVIYTVMGGMKAVVWTDVLQFFVLAGGMIAVVVILCFKVDGGFFGAITYAHENGRALNRFADPDFYRLNPYIRLSFWLLLIHVILNHLTSAASDQINIQRLLSTSDWRAGLKSQIIGSLSGVPFMMMLWFVGMAIYTFYAQHPDPGLRDCDGVFFRFVSTQLPTPLPGLFMAAMLAAIMSTLDSGMNSMATVWLKSFHQKYINPGMSPAEEVSVSRWSTFAVGVIAILFGLGLEFSGKWLEQSAAEVGTLFGILGAAALPAFLFAVLSKRANATLVWGFTFFALGESIAGKLWYVASRVAEKNWHAGEPLGWAGPISYSYAVIGIVLGVALTLPWWRAKQRKLWMTLTALTGMTIAGFGEGMLNWAFFSNLLITDSPMSRSFAFALPIPLLIGLVALFFCKVQPKEKYQGLTLDTINEPLITPAAANAGTPPVPR